MRRGRGNSGQADASSLARWGGEIVDLKSAVDFRALVDETHEVDRSGKTLCPFHDDHRPSFQVYADHGYCFSCGAYADHITWLGLANGLSTAEAIKELRRRAGGYVPHVTRHPKRPVKSAEGCAARPVPADVLASYMQRVARLDRLPSALEGRGFTLEDARTLHLVRDHDDLLFTIPGPDGVVLAIKRRYARPRGDQRYTYETPGHGTPAWCSPKMLEHHDLLVVEGELNAMACHLARPDIGVMGTAGAGARKVYVIEPWGADACELAGTLGRDALRERLQ